MVFDRGLQRRKSLDLFTYTNKLFVGRLRPKSKLRVTDCREVPVAPEGSTITISSDTEGYLYDSSSSETAFTYRIINGVINESGETICLVSNLMDADAYLLAQWYKQRWDIEVFFKFIKQHLNASHLASRTENGIKVMLYMTMILAILIIVYKKKNKMAGFKIAKLKFEIELDNEIIKTIVILCGGNPDRAPHLFASG
ncbi:MAG: transposase [Prevotellaceae bacterium]|nr:transposase [Prevotellaceae bacterium]